MKPVYDRTEPDGSTWREYVTAVVHPGRQDAA